MTSFQRHCLTGLLSLLLLVAAGPSASGQTLTEERGVERRGDSYQTIRTRDLGGCKDICLEDPRCAAYSFHTRSGQCSLKSTVGDAQRSPNRISGVKGRGAGPGTRPGAGAGNGDFIVESGYDHRGGDYQSLTTRSAVQCEAACSREPRCLAFTFNIGNSTCYLKERVGERQSNSEAVTGVRRGAGEMPDRPGYTPDRARLTEERGYDYPGGDYNSFRARDLDACRAECRRDTRCEAYTFNTNTDICYLKDEVGERRPYSAAVSGRRASSAPMAPGGNQGPNRGPLTERRGYDYHGGDYTNMRTADLDACQEACRRDERCAAYTFNTQGNTCYLKESIGNLERNDNTVTGVRRNLEDGSGDPASPYYGNEDDRRLTEERGYDYRGGDYRQLESSNLEACQRACYGEDRCVAYSFATQGRTCYLKDSLGVKERNEDVITGRRRAIRSDDDWWGEEYGWGGDDGSDAGRDDDWRGGREEGEYLTEERGYDYRGGDFEDFRSADLDGCKVACRRESRCRAYSFNVRTGACYLKSSVGDRVSSSDIITGRWAMGDESWPEGRWEDEAALTEERGYDYRGGDYEEFRTRSLTSCQTACGRDDRCMAYTYNTRTETCYLKDEVGFLDRNEDTITGARVRPQR